MRVVSLQLSVVSEALRKAHRLQPVGFGPLHLRSSVFICGKPSPPHQAAP